MGDTKNIRKLLTIDDLVKFCSEQNFTRFSSKETGYKLSVQVPATFEVDDEVDNDHRGMMRLKFRIFHTGLNRNGSFVSEEAAKNAMPTIKNRPILAHIHQLAFGLCTTTWAWYGNSVSSSSTTIKTASCVVIPTVETEGNEVFAQTDGSYLFLADVEYTVTITAEGTSSSAYCKLISDGAEYYTQQIDTVAPDDEISFKLKFTMDKTVFIDTRFCLTSRGSGVRLPLLPQIQRKHLSSSLERCFSFTTPLPMD